MLMTKIEPQKESIGVTTQFQQVDNTKHIVNDFYIINRLRASKIFIAEKRQHVQKKVIYSQKFGKIKKALNIALDFDCMNEFISIIDTFIARKKNSIEETSQENINMDIADPIVCKYRG
ncbi:22887_t:CDS:2 [Gigaspora margarita]|uniref:22887_t:CDS:1 n=1 Tax=Gigaspora margarita TaxID=4874 RepID=A0ABN7V8J9_GIGMA|nr:22887_t:CDS:2 [Gigaspora margarita]